MYNNVNANILTCAKVRKQGECYSYQQIFDVVSARKNEKPYRLNPFEVILQLSILFSEEKDDSENIVKIGRTYEFLVKIKHNDSKLSKDLLKFEIFFSDDNILYSCGKKYYSTTRAVEVKNLDIPAGLGNYSIELFMREKTGKDENEWFLQSISNLLVC